MFLPGSRYAALPVLRFLDATGKELAYVSRRFLPSGDEFDLLLLRTVVEGERLDNITAQVRDDPQQFWRICDANDAMSPFDLVAQAGKTIRITLPQGIPGNRNA
jgi:hypothetical protein